VKYIIVSLLVLSAFVGGSAAQSPSADGRSAQSGPDRFDAEKELARLAVEAHGGSKLRDVKNLVVRGTADVTIATQTIAVSFVNIFAGEKYRFELNNPFQPIKQVSNGVETSSSMQGGFSLPPVNRLGFPILQRIGDVGFIVTALPDNKKKRKGFRVTSPEGYYTDFYLDSKSNQIKGYDSTFVVNGRKVTTSVEIDKLRTVDGIAVPERYVQRFDLDQFTVYANFKAREILVNTQLDEDVFAIGG
jgi:hypothetical protein